MDPKGFEPLTSAV